MAVVVDEARASDALRIEANPWARRAEADPVTDDAGVKEAGLNRTTSQEDGCGDIEVRLQGSLTWRCLAAKDRGVSLRIDVHEIRGKPCVLGEELGDAGVADYDELTTDRRQVWVGHQFPCAEPGAVHEYW